MKYDTQDPYENKSKRGGKGFYAALAVCAVAVCGVAVASFAGGISADTGRGTTAATTTTAVHQVDLPVTDVPDTRTTVTTTTRTASSTVTTTKTTAANLFVFPVSNRVLAAYSEEMVYSETLGEWGTHNGVDFAAAEGDRVKAPADGTVSRIVSDSLWGDIVEIDHGGRVTSRCCGVKAQGIREGQTVKAGEVIGTVGEIAAEVVSGPHIHVEILANGKPVDPLLLISGKTVDAAGKTTATVTTTATTAKK